LSIVARRHDAMMKMRANRCLRVYDATIPCDIAVEGAERGASYAQSVNVHDMVLRDDSYATLSIQR